MLTEEQRLKRRSYLGASDMPSILGCGFQSTADIYLEKTGQLNDLPVKDFDPIDMGNHLEKPTLDLFERARGVELIRDVWTERDIFCANLDGLIQATGTPVEAKSSGLAEEWGEEGTDEIPDRVIIQTHVQMWCVEQSPLYAPTLGECRVAYVPVLIPAFKHFEHRIYEVQRNNDLLEQILAAGMAFMTNHVKARVPPDPYRPALETLKRARRVAGLVTMLDDEAYELWARYQDLGERVRTMEKERKIIQARILVKLVDVEGNQAEKGLLSNGQALTYFEQSSTPSVNYNLLKLRDPELYEAVVRQGRHRVLRLSKKG